MVKVSYLRAYGVSSQKSSYSWICEKIPWLNVSRTGAAMPSTINKALKNSDLMGFVKNSQAVFQVIRSGSYLVGRGPNVCKTIPRSSLTYNPTCP